MVTAWHRLAQHVQRERNMSRVPHRTHRYRDYCILSQEGSAFRRLPSYAVMVVNCDTSTFWNRGGMKKHHDREEMETHALVSGEETALMKARITMSDQRASVVVNAPVEQVYALFTHFNDFPKF